MPDGAHHRRTAGRYGSNQTFIGKRQEVLHGTAAACDDDDLDIRVAIQMLHRSDELFAGLRSLDKGVSSDNPYGRPTSPRVLHDVALGCALFGDALRLVGDLFPVRIGRGVREALGQQVVPRVARPHLDQLTGMLQRNQDALAKGIRNMAPFVRLFNNAVGNGRWFDNYICGLLPPSVGSFNEEGCLAQ